MTDDELEARLRDLAARPAREPQFWDEMAADVRADYAAESERSRRRQRRRRIATPLAGVLALAAAFVVYVRVHSTAVPEAGEPYGDEFGLYDEPDPGEMIEQLTPAQLERVAQAFKQGA